MIPVEVKRIITEVQQCLLQDAAHNPVKGQAYGPVVRGFVIVHGENHVRQILQDHILKILQQMVDGVVCNLT